MSDAATFTSLDEDLLPAREFLDNLADLDGDSVTFNGARAIRYDFDLETFAALSSEFGDSLIAGELGGLESFLFTLWIDQDTGFIAGYSLTGIGDAATFGLQDDLAGGRVTFTVSVTFSDYNDPSIVIEPPTG